MMARVLILGANGQLARNTTRVLLGDPALTLTLYLRRANRLKNPAPERVAMVEGDVLDAAALRRAMQDQDVAYANLAGDMARQAHVIIDAMHATGLKRQIFISSMGIYGQVPGEKYRSVLDPYRQSAVLIEASDLDYTILRAGLVYPRAGRPLSDHGEGRALSRTRISLGSLSTLIVRIAKTPGLYVGSSIGVSDN
jgi:nucleoside-diphosphate-sugar epimerase